jgi:hypothetical protein
MKNMARSKRLSIVVSAVFFVFTCVSVPHAGFVPDIPWETQIRPGVMDGDDDAGTDYFIDLLMPFWGSEKALVFFNPVYRFDDDDETEWNLGLGTRLLLMNDALILGGNVFFDTIETEENHDFDQWGVGVEALSHWVDFRANYYNPTGDSKERIEDLDRYSFGSTSILLNRGWEEALEGYDAEIGFLVPFVSNYIETRVYGGFYAYESDVSDDIDGTRFRLELVPMPLIHLNLEVTDDDMRDTTWVGGYLSIPFSFESNPFKGIRDALAFGKGARSVPERMTEKVVRDRHVRTERLVADDPDTVVADIVYVNADNPDPGEGTYENPYKHISLFDEADARWQPGTWIYVFSWDNEGDTQEDVNFTLLRKMVLWGEGYSHPLFKYQLGGGPNPTLDGGGGEHVLALGNQNEVMGLTIQNAEHGIYGENIKRTNIHDNIIRDNIGPTTSGIHIVNDFDFTGRGSDWNLLYVIANNQLLNNAGYGAHVCTTITSDAISNINVANVFANNTVERNSEGGLYAENALIAQNATPGSDLVVSISDSSVSNTFSGNVVTLNGGMGIYSGNSIMANANTESAVDGSVVASISGSSIGNTFTGNEVSSNADTGVYVARTMMADAEAYASVNGSVTASVSGSSVDSTFTDNAIKYNDGYGVFMQDGDQISNLKAYAYVEGAASDVLDDVSASVTDSSLNNLFANNDISNNFNVGVHASSGMGVTGG